jgi:hypothetical protein
MQKKMLPAALIKGTAIVLSVLSSLWLPEGLQAAQETTSVAAGSWGGEHIILEVSRAGGEIEFDCAQGKITQSLFMNRAGDFEVAGTFTPQHGGPVRRDENTVATPAHYSGHIEGQTEGQTMTLTVTLDKEKEKLGPFTLVLGSTPRLRKCV